MKKKATIQAIRRDILLKMLPDVPFDGWTVALFDRAIAQTNYASEMIRTALPNSIKDCVTEFACFIDEEMMEVLHTMDTTQWRVRDKVKVAVQTRIDAMQPYKEAERLAVSYWMIPSNSRCGAKSVWQTADCIWDFAGDTATDYNRYSKRALLSGILAKTTLFWLQDQSENYSDTDQFLDRQIDRVLNLGQKMGKFKGIMNRIWNKRPMRGY